MRYWIEKYYPFAVAVMITLLIYKFEDYMAELKTLIPQVAQNSLTISGTLLGFLLTILTIINTINTRRMQFVKSTGNYGRLSSFLNLAIKANIFLILTSFFIIFINPDKFNNNILQVVNFSFIFITVFAISLTIRFAVIFIKLLTDK